MGIIYVEIKLHQPFLRFFFERSCKSLVDSQTGCLPTVVIRKHWARFEARVGARKAEPLFLLDRHISFVSGDVRPFFWSVWVQNIEETTLKSVCNSCAAYCVVLCCSTSIKLIVVILTLIDVMAV